MAGTAPTMCTSSKTASVQVRPSHTTLLKPFLVTETPAKSNQYNPTHRNRGTRISPDLSIVESSMKSRVANPPHAVDANLGISEITVRGQEVKSLEIVVVRRRQQLQSTHTRQASLRLSLKPLHCFEVRPLSTRHNEGWRMHACRKKLVVTPRRKRNERRLGNLKLNTKMLPQVDLFNRVWSQ